jgi:predicted dehydrogenase
LAPSIIRVGFIGAGRMAHVHANLIKSEPDVKIVAASDHGSGRAHDFARTWGATAFSDYRRLLDETQLDAVYICTPTHSHAEIGLACAERNLHMFVEKPLDLDLRSGARLAAEVERRGLLAMTAFQWRYSPAYRRAEELVGGEPIALVSLRWYWTRPPIRWMWQRGFAGGQIVDQNIHLIDASQGAAGEITRVYAAYNKRQVNFEPEFDNWDGYALTLHYRSGTVGTCAGTYGLFPEIQKGPAIDLCLRDRMVRITDQDVTLFTPSGTQTWQNNEPLHRGVNRAFITALRENDPTHIRTPLVLGLRSTAITLAANHSAQTGQPVDVDAFLDDEIGASDGP